MQLIQLEREGWNFFCPSTGQPVFNETGEPNASSVRAVWCHEVPDEPQLLCTELKAQWAAHLAIQDAADEAVDVVAFLNSVDHPGWVAVLGIKVVGFLGALDWQVRKLDLLLERGNQISQPSP